MDVSTFSQLKESSHYATETGAVSTIRGAVANVLCASNTIDEMYLSSSFGEVSDFPRSPYLFGGK
jgi:hypothetical protein